MTATAWLAAERPGPWWEVVRHSKDHERFVQARDDWKKLPLSGVSANSIPDESKSGTDGTTHVSEMPKGGSQGRSIFGGRWRRIDEPQSVRSGQPGSTIGPAKTSKQESEKKKR